MTFPEGIEKIQEFKTDFAFKDKRDYVHASTMLEELTKLVYGNYYPEEKWEGPKVDAKFHKSVLYNGVFKLSEKLDALTDYDSANAVFRFFNDDRSISATFHENDDMSVVRRIKTSNTVEDISLEKAYSGLCKIDGSSRVSLIENIIEANKRIHLLTLRDRDTDLKVINLYMKKFPVSLPIHEDIDYGRVKLKIENVSVRHRDDSAVTLNSLWFPELKMERFEISYIVEGI